MVLFFKVLFTMFIAEMGDKTQLLLIALTSRFKVRDIVLGSAAAILALNGLAVALGSIISQFVPDYLIKLVAGAAFFYFACTTLKKDDDEEEGGSEISTKLPSLAVFGTFFIAELGDKTQLTAITFAANEGTSNALLIWIACSVGLFAADMIGMLAGYLLKSKMPEGLLNTLAFFIFAVFGLFTIKESGDLLFGASTLYSWCLTLGALFIFCAACFILLKKRKTAES